MKESSVFFYLCIICSTLCGLLFGLVSGEWLKEREYNNFLVEREEFYKSKDEYLNFKFCYNCELDGYDCIKLYDSNHYISAKIRPAEISLLEAKKIRFGTTPIDCVNDQNQEFFHRRSSYDNWMYNYENY